MSDWLMLAEEVVKIQPKGMRTGRLIAPPPLVDPARGTRVHAIPAEGGGWTMACGLQFDRIIPLQPPRDWAGGVGVKVTRCVGCVEATGLPE